MGTTPTPHLTMKTYLLTLSLALGLLPLASAATVPFPDVPAAKEQAKAAGKPTLILWHGSDWMEESAKLCSEWQKLASSAEEPLPVIFGQFDEKVGTTDETRNKVAMPFPEYDLPVAVLFAPDGTYMASYRGKTVLSAASMQKAVKKSLAHLPQFTALVKQARETQGKASATAAGKALSLLAPKDARRHPELVRLINERDPQDETGYRSKFCYEHMGMYKLINDLLKGGAEGSLGGAERRFDEAEQYVKDILSRKGGTQPELDKEMQQQWLAGLYYVQKERMCSTGKQNKDLKEVLSTLKRIIQLNPKSEYGKGAKTYLRYWEPDSFFEIKDFFYDASNQSHGFEKDWHVDVTKKVKSAGTYTFSLTPYANGPLVTRNFRLVINGKEVARPAVDPKTDTKSVDLTVPDLPKNAKVEVWLTAQCNDHWLNCSGRIDMKKK